MGNSFQCSTCGISFHITQSHYCTGKTIDSSATAATCKNCGAVINGTIHICTHMLTKKRIEPDKDETVKGRIIELLTKQTEKGLSKYGHTLDDCPDDKFDWRLMAMEELIDLVQYQQKEIMRLETDKNNLICDKALLEKLLNP